MSIGFDDDDVAKPADRTLMELKAQTRKLAGIEKWTKRIFWLQLGILVLAPIAMFVFNLIQSGAKENEFKQFLGAQQNQGADKSLDDAVKALQGLMRNQR
jgi:hypothetical protein